MQVNDFKSYLNACYVIFGGALVFFMVPGLAFYYSGLSESKNALTLLLLCLICITIVSFQWYAWGYSLALSDTGGSFIGNFDYAFLMNCAGKNYGTLFLPKLAHCFYQCMFAVISPALIIGAVVGRLRILSCSVFIFLWATFVYDFLAYWTWAPNGWMATLGVLDFAGGIPVHISSGSAALAYAIIMGRREGFGKRVFKPHSLAHTILGTALLWFGWFGFNGGSTLAPNARAAMGVTVTNMAASVGGITWMMVDYLIYKKKFSAFAFCAGAVAGLVSITPAAGFVSPTSSIFLGFAPGILCNFACKAKEKFHYDDAMDVFAIHGIGGLVGSVLTGIFAEKDIAALDGTVIAGGFYNQNFTLVGYQFGASVISGLWSFTISYILLWIINKIPGLSLRISLEDERNGADQAECGEVAYKHVEEEISDFILQSADTITLHESNTTFSNSIQKKSTS